MSSLTGPNFYSIDFDREVVLQGKSTTFITINRNNDVLSEDETLYAILYPMSRTFESVGEFLLYQTSASGQTAEKTSQGFISQDLTKVGHLSFGNIAPGLYVKNTQDFLPDSEGPLIVSAIDSLTVPSSGEKLTKVTLVGPTGGSDPYVGATGSSVPKRINVGYYSNVDQNNWRINTAPIKDIEKVCYGVTGQGIAIDYSTYKNPFDGSTYSATGGIVGGFSGTGFISRSVNDGWSQSKVDSLSNSRNAGMTFRIDYEGGDDSHLKLNMLIFRYDPTSSSTDLRHQHCQSQFQREQQECKMPLVFQILTMDTKKGELHRRRFLQTLITKNFISLDTKKHRRGLRGKHTKTVQKTSVNRFMMTGALTDY